MFFVKLFPREVKIRAPFGLILRGFIPFRMRASFKSTERLIKSCHLVVLSTCSNTNESKEQDRHCAVSCPGVGRKSSTSWYYFSAASTVFLALKEGPLWHLRKSSYFLNIELYLETISMGSSMSHDFLNRTKKATYLWCPIAWYFCRNFFNNWMKFHARATLDSPRP